MIKLAVLLLRCGSLDNPGNGLVSYTDTVYNAVATYSCDEGYELVGDNTYVWC